jgi:hypothetical protein
VATPVANCQGCPRLRQRGRRSSPVRQPPVHPRCPPAGRCGQEGTVGSPPRRPAALPSTGAERGWHLIHSPPSPDPSAPDASAARTPGTMRLVAASSTIWQCQWSGVAMITACTFGSANRWRQSLPGWSWYRVRRCGIAVRGSMGRQRGWARHCQNHRRGGLRAFLAGRSARRPDEGEVQAPPPRPNPKRCQAPHSKGRAPRLWTAAVSAALDRVSTEQRENRPRRGQIRMALFSPTQACPPIAPQPAFLLEPGHGDPTQVWLRSRYSSMECPG